MYAIIETGGKQYRVSEGDILSIEKLLVESGQELIFDKVLLMGDGETVQIGTPFVADAQVTGRVIENGKGPKVIIFKYKAKKDYRKKQGHRQPYTKVEITGMGIGKTKAIKSAKAPETVVASAEEKAAVIQETPSLKSMKKDELIAFAAEHGIEIDAKATKPVIIAAIEAKLD